MVTGFSGYRLVSYFCRSESIHGGVVIYCQNVIKCNPIALPHRHVQKFICECASASLNYWFFIDRQIINIM